MSNMNASATIQSAIATSISEDRTVEVRVQVTAFDASEWIADMPDDCDYAKINGDDGVYYDVWGTTEDGDEFRLSVIEVMAE